MEKYINIDKYNGVFATRLRKLMEDRKVVRKELYTYCAVDRATLRRYENGDSLPKQDTLLKIAEFFNVSPDFLLGKSNNQTTNEATKELCKTLGLSERSIDFLRKDIPLHYQEWEKANAIKTFDVAQTVLILDTLLADHIDYLTNQNNRKEEKKYSLLTLLQGYLDHVALWGSATVYSSNNESLPVSDVNESISIQQNVKGGLFANTSLNLKDLLIAQDIQNITTFLQTQSIKGIDRAASIDYINKIGGDKK